MSTRRPDPIACPACDVPPPRIVIEQPNWRQMLTVSMTSWRDLTTTTPSGSIW
jgi:hypothetical protein